MLLYFPFDGDITNYGDPTYSANLVGASYVGSQCGQGLSFDGVDDYVQINPTLNLTNDYTVTAWINPNAQVDWMSIFSIREQCVSTYRGYSMAQFGLGEYNVPTLSCQINNHINCTGFSTGDRYTEPSILIPNGTETFVAVTVQNNSSENRVVKLYVNCQEFSTIMTIDYPSSASFDPLINYTTTIGAGSPVSGWSSTFDGTVDEVRVYDIALTSDEIQDVYQSCLPPSLDVQNFQGCAGDSAVITLYNSEPDAVYQLIDITNATNIGSPQLGNCGPLTFYTGFVTDTTQFEILSNNTISGCSINMDSIVTLFPTYQTFYGTNTVNLCYGDSLLINGQYYSSTGIYNDTIALSFNCDSVITLSVTVLPPNNLNIGADTSICMGQSVTMTSNIVGSSYLWQDGSTLNSQTATQTGTYWVEVTTSCGIISDTLVISTAPPPAVNLGNDTTICLGSNLVLDVNTPGASYLWQDGSLSSSYSVTTDGLYWVELTVQGCANSDTIIVITEATPNIDLGNDTSFCIGQQLVLDPGILSGQLLWSDNSSGNTLVVNQTGTYWLNVSNSCGSFTDSIDLVVAPSPNVNLGNDTTICIGASVVLDVNTPGGSYLWQDGSLSSSYSVTSDGLYWVELTVQGCANSDTINVTTEAVPLVDLGNDTSFCSGQQLVLDPGIINGQLLWSDNSSGNTLVVNQTGTYWLAVMNACGTITDSIDVVVVPNPIVDLGNDTTLCSGTTLELNASQVNANYVWQDGSTASNFIVTQGGIYSVIASIGGCSATDQISVSYINPPYVNLGNDTTICIGSNLFLTVVDQSAGISWNNGSSEPTLLVNSEGIYSVNLQHQCGSATDTITIFTRECFCSLYVPNSFTPDGNEFNQTFGPKSDCPMFEFELVIYNRWGQLIFTSNDPNGFWDGTYLSKKAQNGVYTYKITYAYESGEGQIITGHVALIR